MNKKQCVTIAVGALLLLVSALYPTWTVRVKGLELGTIRASLYVDGRTILKRFAKANDIKQLHNIPSVIPDYHRMSVECGLIIVLTIGASAVLRDRRPKSHGSGPNN
jgi:hypothetical protein